jgi:hypothetical protein
LNTLGMHALLGLRAGYLPCRLSPHLGVITTTLDLEQGAAAGGRAFERLWLRITALGLALQPMAASTVLCFQEPSATGVSDKVRTTLRLGWSKIVGEATPLMLFRLGRAEKPAVLSLRKPLEAYLRDPPI